MGLVGEAAVTLLAICAIALLLVTQWNRVARRRKLAAAPWCLGEHSDGATVSVYAERPGEVSLLVGSVPFDSPRFEDEIEEVRFKGLQRVMALNSGRRAT